MIKKIFLLLSFTTLFTTTNYSQNSNKNLDKEIYNFILEVDKEITTLKTAENKLLFSAQIAAFLNKYDSEKSKKMFQQIEIDFLELYKKYEAFVNKVESSEGTEEFYYNDAPSIMMSEISKFQNLMRMRNEVAFLMAQNNAFKAYEFSKKTHKKKDKDSSRYYWLYSRINADTLFKIMPTQNVDKSMDFGRTLLKGGEFDRNVLVLAKSIYENNEEKGVEFGKELIAKFILECSKKDTKSSYCFSENIYSILDAGSLNLSMIKDENKKPLFEKKALVRLSELFAQKISEKKPRNTYQRRRYFDIINKFSPQNSKILPKNSKAKDARKDMVEKAREEFIRLIKERDKKRSPKAKAREDRRKKHQQFAEALKTFSSKEFSPKEKEVFIKDVRKVISSVKNPHQKIWLLTELAFQLSFSEDKISLELLSEADLLVNKNPESLFEFVENWRLASGYAGIDDDKAFSILENAVVRLNKAISGLHRLFRFMKPLPRKEGMIIEDEIAFNGTDNIFIGGLTRSGLSYFDITVYRLAQSDFKRLKTLANRFDRREIQILAKILILQKLVENKHWFLNE